MSSRPAGINTRICERLARVIGQRRYDLWIEPSVRLDYRDTERTLRVAVANRFVAEKIRAEFTDDLRAAARAELGQAEDAELLLDVCVAPDQFSAAKTPTTELRNAAGPGSTDHASDPSSAASMPKRPTSSGGGGGAGGGDRWFDGAMGATLRYRFEDFVVGPSNELAYAAAVAVAERTVEDGHGHDPDAGTPAPTSGGPLFIHGVCGLGKTHLLQSVCQRARQRSPQARVMYVTAEQFANAFISAVRENKLEAFRRMMRQLDLLAIDDVEFLSGKEKSQLEFMHCFNHIELNGSRIVIASDSHPKHIKAFSEALVSRCVQGMVVQVQPPDVATRRALVRKMAERRGLVLQGNAEELIAAQAGPSIRELEGHMAHLHALACLAQPQGPTRPVNRALVEKLFASQRQAQADRPVRFDDVRDVVCEQLRVPAAQVAGSSRHKQVVLARSLVVFLTRELTTLSYPEIAAALSKPSHSTIVTAVQRTQRQLQDHEPMLLPGRGEATTLAHLVDELRSAVSRRVAG